MNWHFLRFVSLILGTMAVIHGFLYLSWLSLFSISAPRTRLCLALCLAFLSVSFVAASISVHLSHTMVTRVFYGFSGLWVGLLPWLVPASALALLTKALLPIIPGLPERLPAVLAMVLYLVGAGYTGIGFKNATEPTVRHVRISIRDLPGQWQGRTIVQLSDVHIGGFRGRSYLETVIRKANDQNPDIVAITGDLFDGASADHRSYVDALKALKAEQRVLFITGNHEVYSGVESAIKAVSDAGITVLDNRALLLDGLQFIGIASPRFGKAAGDGLDIAGLPDFNPKAPSILLNHAPTGISGSFKGRNDSLSRNYWSPDTRFDQAIEAGIALQLSGHTHGGQFIPFTWLTRRIFNGFHQGLHRVGSFQIYISPGTGTWGPPIRSGCASEITVIRLEAA